MQRPSLRLLWALVLSLPLLLLTSCHGSSTGGDSTDSVATASDSLSFAREVTIRYARGYQITNHPDYKEITLFHPDTKDTLARYVLYLRGTKEPTLSYQPTDIIPVPIRSIACLTTTQLGALTAVGADSLVTGLGDPEYVTGEQFASGVKEGRIKVISQGMAKNIEGLAALRPEVLLQDLMADTSKDADLRRLGIHLVQYNGWKEETLLGRAEWMLFIGLLTGRSAEAQQSFDRIAKDYNEAKALVAGSGAAVPVLYGLDYQGAWYLPGEFSYAATMLSDAGLKAPITPGVVTGKPVSLERIFAEHRSDSLWLAQPESSVRTKEAFLALNPRYGEFAAAKTGHIFVPNKRVSATGANDIWQSGVYRPDLILKDMISLTHPSLLPGYETTYWMELK